ncbi:MAG: GspE/PulE family protein [Candidatus Aminicenantes bacterium]|nr:GspE/PulE family protein [Candidatus Aminicenantes bacterium]
MNSSPSRNPASSNEIDTRALADRYGVPFTDLIDVPVDRDLVQSFPPEFLYRSNFIPLSADGGTIRIAIADPSDLETIDAIQTLSGKKVSVLAAPQRAVQEALRKSETALQVLKGATEGFIQQVVEKDGGEEEEVISLEKLADQDGSIIKLVNTIIFTAVQKRASDIHIESKDNNVHVKYRLDGVLSQAMDPIDKKFQAPIISRIKVMSDLDIAERRVPQDGRFRLKIKDKTIDFRVSIMPSIYGEYAALTEIRSPEDKIITIEDPVEYQVDGITQIPVNEKKGLTFARGLRSILRHDPDKIMVGEIRDPETAQIAIQSALTGHLVFTTVHANNVIDVIGRFIHMQVDPYSFVSALNCILAQRLVRLLCPKCKTAVRYADEQLRESGLDPALYRNHDFYEAAGCADCGFTGYHGRTAIAEVLDLSDAIREMILIRKPLSEVRKTAKAEGMTSLRDVGAGKVLDGLTSLKELNKVTFVE